MNEMAWIMVTRWSWYLYAYCTYMAYILGEAE